MHAMARFRAELVFYFDAEDMRVVPRRRATSRDEQQRSARP
jgi:hypothetical protein